VTNSSMSGGFLDDLSSAVQANPVPAALIGMGALWMLMGGGRTTAAAALLSSGFSGARDALAPVGEAVKDGAAKVGGAVSGMASATSDAVSRSLATAGETVTDVAGRVGAGVTEAGTQATRRAPATTAAAPDFSGALGSVRGNLSETFERQPLLVGLIGLAVGAAIATAFRTTQLEQEMVGSQAGTAKSTLERFASEQADKLSDVAQRTLDAVKEEAAAQGLTPAGMKRGVEAIRDKAMNVASSVRGNGHDSR